MMRWGPNPGEGFGKSSPWPRVAVFDAEAWKAAVIAAVTTGVRVAAQKAEQSAKEDAPVRDVFRHGNAYRKRGLRRRPLTGAEKASEHGVFLTRQIIERSNATIFTRGTRFRADPYLRRAAPRKHPNAFNPVIGGRIRQGGREVEHGKLRLFPEAGDPENKTLHARGRYELSGKRALTKTGKRMSALYTSKAGGTVATTTLGGRLRGEIHVEGPIQAGSIIAAKVVSPTYYAKYQEFGTRHNRATPYMRPAVAKLRISYRNEIVKALNRLNTTSGLSRGSRGGMYQ